MYENIAWGIVPTYGDDVMRQCEAASVLFRISITILPLVHNLTFEKDSSYFGTTGFTQLQTRFDWVKRNENDKYRVKYL